MYGKYRCVCWGCSVDLLSYNSVLACEDVIEWLARRWIMLGGGGWDGIIALLKNPIAHHISAEGIMLRS